MTEEEEKSNRKVAGHGGDYNTFVSRSFEAKKLPSYRYDIHQKFHTSPTEGGESPRQFRREEGDTRYRSRSHDVNSGREKKHTDFIPPFMSPTMGAPVVHTKEKKSGTPFGVFFTLLMSIVGSGLFSIPGAMLRAGTWGGCLLIVGVGVAMAYTAELLIRSKISVQFDCVSMEQLVLMTSGRRWSLAFNLVTLLGILGAVISYVVLVKELVPDIMAISALRDSFLGSVSTEVLTVIIFTGFVFPMCLLRNISSLRFSSYVGFMLSLYILILLLEEAIRSDRHFPGREYYSPLSVSDFSIAGGIVNFSFVLHINVLPLFQELVVARSGDTQSAQYTMVWIVRGVVCVVMMIYILFGLSGLTLYGTNVEGNVLKNFSHQPRFQLARIATVLVVVTAFPLLFYPLRSISLQMIRRSARYVGWTATESISSKTPSIQLHVIATVLLVGFVILLALQIPGIQYVFSLTGGTAVIAMCYFFPALIFAKQLRASDSLPLVFSWIRRQTPTETLIDPLLSSRRQEEGEEPDEPPLSRMADGPLSVVSYRSACEGNAISLLVTVSVLIGILSTTYTVSDL